MVIQPFRLRRLPKSKGLLFQLGPTYHSSPTIVFTLSWTHRIKLTKTRIKWYETNLGVNDEVTNSSKDNISAVRCFTLQKAFSQKCFEFPLKSSHTYSPSTKCHKLSPHTTTTKQHGVVQGEKKIETEFLHRPRVVVFDGAKRTD